MYVVLSLMMAIASCLIVYYGSGELQVIVFQTDAERRDAIWLAVLVTTMFAVVAACLSR